MPERKSHVKSRNGCQQCKARRVKCNELRPVCSNCTRRQEDCSYGVSSSPVPSQAGQDQNALAQQRQLHMKELELMHHYSISTYETMALRTADKHTAQTMVPGLGLLHPFLLDALFAFTSLHLAFLKPMEARSYVVDASRYQSQALAYCRQQLPVLAASECRAMFHCSAALGMIALAFRTVDPDTQHTQRPTATICQLAQLWRGTLFIRQTSADLVDPETYLSMFPPPNYELSQAILDPRVEQYLELLRSKARASKSRCVTPRRDTDTVGPQPGKCHNAEHEPGTELSSAIDLLQESFAMHHQYPNKVLAWLVLVGASFMDFVGNQEPLASATILLWSVTFRALDGMWWATGFRRQLVNELVPLVSSIDADFAELAEWVDSQT